MNPPFYEQYNVNVPYILRIRGFGLLISYSIILKCTKNNMNPS